MVVENRAGARESFAEEQVKRHQETPQVGRLLSLYVDDSVADPTPFGEVRQRAYKIMAKDVLQNTAQRMSVKPLNKLTLHWQAVDGQAKRIRRHLRPLFVALEFAATVDPDAGRRLLTEHRVPIDVLCTALTDMDSPYAHTVAAVCQTLPAATDRDVQRARHLTQAGPPAEAVGLQPFTLTVPPRRPEGDR